MERVDLHAERHAEKQRWRNGGEWDMQATKIAIGTMAGGRWYVRLYDGGMSPIGERIGRAYSGPHAEHYARSTARRWRRTIGGEWIDCAAKDQAEPFPGRTPAKG
jgi:hypothetical protein